MNNFVLIEYENCNIYKKLHPVWINYDRVAQAGLYRNSAFCLVWFSGSNAIKVWRKSTGKCLTLCLPRTVHTRKSIVAERQKGRLSAKMAFA